ncbi:MAG: hypothetical protein AMXMBFR53_25580 [Gemmatimonadota bacterium]
MLILARALLWGSAFVAFVLVYLPAQTLAWSGVSRPEATGTAQWAGAALVLLGIVPMAWSFLSFVFLGKGTAAPFDPPRRLVVEGPYRYVRNPMYLGAAISLAGAALYYLSPWLGAYVLLFLTWAHLFVRHFEEPRLRRAFGEAYGAYTGRVRRWLPGRPGRT